MKPPLFSGTRNDEHVVKVGLLYSSINSTVWPAAFTATYAAELAVQKIHESGLLPNGTSLEIVPIATDCDADVARATGLAVLEEDQIKVFIGPACGPESEQLCGFVAHPFFAGSVYQKPFLIATASVYEPVFEIERKIIRLATSSIYPPLLSTSTKYSFFCVCVWGGGGGVSKQLSNC